VGPSPLILRLRYCCRSPVGQAGKFPLSDLTDHATGGATRSLLSLRWLLPSHMRGTVKLNSYLLSSCPGREKEKEIPDREWHRFESTIHDRNPRLRVFTHRLDMCSIRSWRPRAIAGIVKELRCIILLPLTGVDRGPTAGGFREGGGGSKCGGIPVI